MLGFFLDSEILGESDLFLVILLGDHDALQVLGVDLELTERSSISLEENFSPQVIRECLNISASIC